MPGQADQTHKRNSTRVKVKESANKTFAQESISKQKAKRVPKFCRRVPDFQLVKIGWKYVTVKSKENCESIDDNGGCSP